MKYTTDGCECQEVIKQWHLLMSSFYCLSCSSKYFFGFPMRQRSITLMK